MAELITPSRLHKYVVGIDFGHAETSACVCEIEWDKDANLQNPKLNDVVLWRNSNSRILVSAISKTKDEVIHIHTDAFKYIDGDNCRIGFKSKPLSLKGDKEQLMVAFMKEVYGRILQNTDSLQEGNHIVYIARPSGWQDAKSKELYTQMALSAGIPLAGLTSESRAAIFYARQPSISFSVDISQGAIVFDIGSSTLDLTYLSKSIGPIDRGENLGASIIDRAIYNKMILEENPSVKAFVKNHPEYEDPLLFRARRFKEEVYSAGEGTPSPDSFLMDEVLLNVPEDISAQLEDIPPVRLRVQDAEELNALVDKESDYQNRISEFLKEFKKNNIGTNPVNGVLLVGGASKMYYLPPLISKALSISKAQVKREDEPNLTVSRGIALLGTKDVITSILQMDFKESLPNEISSRLNDTAIKLELSKAISHDIWKGIMSKAREWEAKGKAPGKEEFQGYIKKLKISEEKLSSSCVKQIHSFLGRECKELIDGINAIIAFYAPEVTINADDLSVQGVLPQSTFSFVSKVLDRSLPEIAKAIANTFLSDLVLHLFGKDMKSRKKMVDRLPAHEEYVKVCVKIELNEIYPEEATEVIQKSIIDLLDSKLHEVRIPIE